MIQEVFADELNQQVENALASVLEIVADVVQQLFRTSNLNEQGGIRTAVYHAVKHVTLNLIQTAVFGEKVDKHVDKYLEGRKAAEVL